jgi:PAS domain S-box-containing protein
MDREETNPTRPATEISNSGLAGTTRSLNSDDAERLWAVTNEGVFYFDHGRFVRVPGLDGNTSSIAGDGHGNVWIIQKRRVFLWSPHAGVHEISLSQFSQMTIRTELPNPSTGGLWLGFFQGGVGYLEHGKVVHSYGVPDGLGGGRVNRLRFGADNEVLAATENGLSRISDGHIETLTSRNGLPCDEVYWSMEDDDHNVWTYMPCGLAKISRAEWDAWTSNSRHVVKPQLFDTSDGVRSVGLYAYHASRVSKSPDGKLWFSPSDGVSVVDSHHLPFNSIPPPVHIEQVTADHRTFDASENLRLPPLVHNLEIDYAALSLVAPEKVLFRYKLEGVDRDWQDVRTRRQAFYNNLAPGSYRFRVIACNNDGVWNEIGDQLSFSIAPAWFQTNLFRISCVTAFAVLLWMLYHLRVSNIQRRSKQLALLNAELKTQIAENAALNADLQLQVGLLQHLPVSAWTLKPDGTPDFVNQVWLEFAGQSIDFVRSHPEAWMTAVHPEDREKTAKRFWEGVHSGDGFAIETRSLRAQDETYRWHLQQAVVLRDAEGNLLKFVGTTTDIDDQKRIEEDLRQAQSNLARINRVTTMGELAASLAHEISQPISGVITNANVCLRKLGHDKTDLAELRAAITRIARDGQRAAEILAKIRFQFQKGALDREVLDVNQITRETIALLHGEAMRYDVLIRTELAPGLPEIIGDPVQIQQVVMNLIVNSIEAMKEVDRVRELVIRSERAGNEQILISVSDTGIGVPPQLAEQIFDPFFTTKPHGTGMGLRICRSIIESHGGHLWDEDSAGQGATFRFTLPIGSEHQTAHQRRQ